ncbi:MAG: S8 family serine peptidase [Defluviitaleaceae bacterium]|nr:S8 family serine peptidase [Defluviitaleaceae bacterium]
MNAKLRKFGGCALVLVLFFTMLNTSPIIVSANTSNNEAFFSEVSRLVADNWSDDFFGNMIFTVNDPYVWVDGERRLIDPITRTSPAIVDDMVRLPRAVLPTQTGAFQSGETSFGVSRDSTFDMTDFFSQLDIFLGEIDSSMVDAILGQVEMILDEAFLYIDLSGGMIQRGNVATHSSFSGSNLGYEIHWNASNQQLTLTRDFQTQRLIVQANSSIDFTSFGASDIVRGANNLSVLQFSTTYEAIAAYNRLNGLNSVVWVEPDRVMVTSYAGATSISPTPSTSRNNLWGIERIGAVGFANQLRNSGRNISITVAVIDTGVDSSHPHFNGRMVQGRNFVANNNNTNDIETHGTHVAGTIIDATPELNVRIMPLMVFRPDGRYADGRQRLTATDLLVANAIRFATDNGVRVINLSLGPREPSQASNSVIQAIQHANSRNAVVVFAAGNSSGYARNFGANGRADVITVAAIDSSNRGAIFTNWGSSVDVSAPGVWINSSLPGGRFGYKQGTSMAAPHVSAAVAMYILNNPSLSSAQVRNSTVQQVNVPNGWNSSRYGSGVINMSRVSTPTPQPTPTPTPPPPVTSPPPTISSNRISNSNGNLTNNSSNATITISGSNNTVTITGNNNTIVVSGFRNTIIISGSGNAIDRISGSNNEIMVTGSAGTIDRISGSDNLISGSNITVNRASGSNNTLIGNNNSIVNSSGSNNRTQ